MDKIVDLINVCERRAGFEGDEERQGAIWNGEIFASEECSLLSWEEKEQDK